MLDVKNLSFSYGKKNVLNNINFSLEYGKLICLLGVNGAGKSTLFKCILQIFNNYTGNISLDSNDLKK